MINLPNLFIIDEISTKSGLFQIGRFLPMPISNCFSINLMIKGLAPVEDVPHEDGGERNIKRMRQHSPDAGPVDPVSDLYAVLEGSALVPFLESRLQNSSFLEICRHSAVFSVIIEIMREMSQQSSLVSLLGPLPDQQTSLHSLLQILDPQARIVNDKIGKASANGSVPCKASPVPVNIKPEPCKPKKKCSSNSVDENQDLTLARNILNLSKQVTEALKSTGYLPDVNGISVSRSSTPESSSSPTPGASGLAEQVMEDPEEAQYKGVMVKLQYESVEFASTGHHYMKEFRSAAQPSSHTIFRIAQEISSLAAANTLPCTLSSSIFVHSDDGKMTLLKAIITG